MRFSLSFQVGVVLTLSLIATAPLNAEVRRGNEVTINSDEVIEDDVYVFAQKVTVDGTIKGDLTVFAQQIDINGSVQGDLLAAAQRVQVKGSIADDARIAGQVLSIQDGADVGDDLIAAGQSLRCTKASHIRGEVKFAGFQSVFAGRVDKKVSVASSNCELSGTFGEDVSAIVKSGAYGPVDFWDADTPDIELGLTITESADIAGDLNYQSAREANIDPESRIAGKVDHSQIDSATEQTQTVAGRAISLTKHFFALLIVGLLVIGICPKWTEQVVDNVGRRPLASLVWGGVTLIAIATAAILLLVATIGIAVLLGYVSLDNLIRPWLWLSILTTLLVIACSIAFSNWVTKIIIGVWAGSRIINVSDWTSRQRFLALGLGTLLIGVLTWIPAVGTIVSVVVMLMGLGSTAIWVFSKSKWFVPGKQDA